MQSSKDGGENRTEQLRRENLALREKLQQTERALESAKNARPGALSTTNPFGHSEQLRDDFADIIELLPALACVARPDGQLVYVNPAGRNLIGLAQEPATGLRLDDLYPPTPGTVLARGVTALVNREPAWQGDAYIRHRSGLLIPVRLIVIAHRSPTGEIRNYSTFSRDLREQKMALDLLEQQSALLENANEAIIQVDLEDRIMLWNHGAELVYGWSHREALGRSFAELTFKDPQQYQAARKCTLEAGKWSGEMARITRDRKEITVDSRWSLLRDEEGRPKSFVIISADVTEKKLLAAQFLRAQRLDSIGTLAGGIAHDLNNVLAPILMGVSLLRQRTTNEASLQLLDNFERSAKRGADMVNQVLAFSRGLEGQHAPIAPKHLLREIESFLRDTLPKTIEIDFAYPANLWPVVGDYTQLHQVFINLAVNARDAMPCGGKLRIEAENVLIDDAYRLLNPEARPGPHVVFHIIDNGTGIPAEIREKIFEPFFTTKEVGKGTGLGLATVQTIVKGHGGFINVYSESGRGTTFKIYIPAAPEGKVDIPPISELRLPRGQGELLLVVDDEEIVRETTRAVLERHNYRVLLARDGAEAVALYARNSPDIAVVVTDISMPVMDGIATMRAIKHLNPQVLIICTSGHTSNRQLAVLADAGMSQFLAKPFTAETLLQALHKILHVQGPSAG